MGGKKKQTVGYKYFVGVLSILCHGPIDSIRRIIIGGKTAWSGDVTANTTISVSNENLFGGEESEGGVSGPVEIQMGSVTQARSSYLIAQLGSDVSAFRGVVSLVFRAFYWGTSSYLKDLWVEASRVNTGWDGAAIWYPAKAEITFPAAVSAGRDLPAMNPAHFIRECLISTTWGMGELPADIDDAAFQAAADQLYTEGMGISLTWQIEGSIEDKVKDLRQMVDCALYVDPETGLHTIKLIRNDYVVANLPTLGEAQIISVKDYSRPQFADMANSVSVKYWDQLHESDNVVYQDDAAMIAMLGRVVEESREYSMVVDGDLALRLALRDLRAVTSPMLSCTISATRVAASLRPGDAFKFEWSPFHAGYIIMRVAEINFGSSDEEAIKIMAVEDVFALPANAASAAEDIAWIDPATIALPTAVPLIVEAPYWELVQRYGETQANEFMAATPDAGMILVSAAQVGTAMNALVYSDGVAWRPLVDLSPRGTLSTAAGFTDLNIDITWTGTPETGSHIQVGEELMQFDGFTGGGLSIVQRGILDTVTQQHVVSEVAWAWDSFGGTDEVERAGSETVAYQVQLRNAGNLGALSTAVNYTFASRAVRPYPPGQLRINGSAYPVSIAAGSALALTWAHRDRLLQTAAFVDESEASIGPETGTTYTVKLYGEDGVTVLRTVTGITADNYTYLTADELADSGLGRLNTSLRAEVWSVRDGYDSWQAHDVTVTR